MIASLQASGISVEIPVFRDGLKVFETASGPRLGYFLRKALFDQDRRADLVSWALEAENYYTMKVSGDHEQTDYSTFEKYAEAQLGRGHALTQIVNMVRWFEVVRPRLARIEIDDEPLNHMELINRLSKSSIEELVPVLANPRIDDRGIEVVVHLVLNGSLRTVRDCRELKEHPAFEDVNSLMDRFQEAGLEPVPTWLQLGLKKLAHLAVAIKTIQLTYGDLHNLVVEALDRDESEIPELVEHIMPHHGREKGHSEAGEDKVELEQVELPLGATDQHTPLILQIIRVTEDGYIAFKVNGAAPVSVVKRVFRKMASDDFVLLDEQGRIIRGFEGTSIVVEKED